MKVNLECCEILRMDSRFQGSSEGRVPMLRKFTNMEDLKLVNRPLFRDISGTLELWKVSFIHPYSLHNY